MPPPTPPFAAHLLRLLPLALLACSPDAQSGSDPVAAATAQNERRINAADVTARQAADAEFMVKAASSALLQVELGKLAQVRAATPAAKAYGTSLLKNRLALLGALRRVAAAKNLALPAGLGKDEQAAYHEVSTQTGAELDRRLLALAIKAQKQDEDAFDDMQEDAYDGDIRALAARYLLPVREFLDKAEDVADELEDLP